MSPSASMAEFAFFKCRACGAEPMVLAENERGQFFHYRHDDPEGLDPHTDAIPLGYVDGVLTRF
ncbi:hypothetical protein ACFYW8_15105 [Streptomyces sp. NPDC002742]|uniref:hypothetical protein n=1 Tax=Streptomyces sp. NPDC002742 TaxID=3364663 RepID=UPI0036BBBCCE